MNLYKLVSESLKPSIMFYHYCFPYNNLESKDIVKLILKQGKIKPGSEISDTDKDYESRPVHRRRSEGVVYLTPHRLEIKNVYRFVIPESTLSNYDIQIKKKIYPKHMLTKILKQYDNIDVQNLFDRYKERRLRALIQILVYQPIFTKGLKVEKALR